MSDKSKLKSGVKEIEEAVNSHSRLDAPLHRMSKAVEENRTLRKKVGKKSFLLCPNSRADPAPSQIGHLFGGLSYSAVARVYQRFSAEAKTNKPLRKILKELRIYLSSVKG